MKKLIPYLVGFAVGVVATLLTIGAGWFDPPVQPNPQPDLSWGQFSSAAKAEFLNNGRDLRLLEDFVYIDPRKKYWLAPKDTVVNGASIPQPFWSILGGPLEGKYRQASIVHDYECERMTQSSESVHVMFYEACRCDGVPENSAKILFAAVYHFGPKWTVETVREDKMIRIGGKRIRVPRFRKVNVAAEVPDMTAEAAEKLRKYINDKDPSIEEIKGLKPMDL